MAETRLTIDQAARRLGITPDGVRKRVRRGALPHARHAGRIYVLLDDEQDAARDEAETVSDQSKTRETADQTPLVEQLRAENARLWAALQRAQEAEAEQRRLLAATIARVPELMAANPTHTPPAPGATGPTPAPAARRPWWRLWGG